MKDSILEKLESMPAEEKKQTDGRWQIAKTIALDSGSAYYDDKILTLNALRQQFKKYGVENPTAEAKKYLVL